MASFSPRETIISISGLSFINIKLSLFLTSIQAVSFHLILQYNFDFDPTYCHRGLINNSSKCMLNTYYPQDTNIV